MKCIEGACLNILSVFKNPGDDFEGKADNLKVTVRAYDLVHGYGGMSISVKLDR